MLDLRGKLVSAEGRLRRRARQQEEGRRRKAATHKGAWERSCSGGAEREEALQVALEGALEQRDAARGAEEECLAE